MIEITLTIDFGAAARPCFEKKLGIADKSTVLDALLFSLPVKTTRKYGMEYFVEEIDSVRNDFANDRGWHFEVNGFRSNVPAERYLIKNGDWIKWGYLD
jgi:Domain of unknown function (DUF4430)